MRSCVVRKRIAKLVGMLLVTGMLCGCASQEKDVPQEDDYQVQLELIVDCVDQWALPIHYANDVYEYAVTDLDGNVCSDCRYCVCRSGKKRSPVPVVCVSWTGWRE